MGFGGIPYVRARPKSAAREGQARGEGGGELRAPAARGAEGELQAHPQQEPPGEPQGLTNLHAAFVSHEQVGHLQIPARNTEGPVSAALHTRLLPRLPFPREPGETPSPRAGWSLREAHLAVPALPRLPRCPSVFAPRPHPVSPHGAPCSRGRGTGAEERPRSSRALQAASQRSPLPTMPLPRLPPVDDVLLVQVLQAPEHLQDDALHLEAEASGVTHCVSSTRRTAGVARHREPTLVARVFWLESQPPLTGGIPESLTQPLPEPQKKVSACSPEGWRGPAHSSPLPGKYWRRWERGR